MFSTEEYDGFVESLDLVETILDQLLQEEKTEPPIGDRLNQLSQELKLLVSFSITLSVDDPIFSRAEQVIKKLTSIFNLYMEQYQHVGYLN